MLYMGGFVTNCVYRIINYIGVLIMDGMEHCRRSSCLWEHRFEIVGMVLIVIGVFLTIGTLSGFGIGMMVLVGGALCLHKHLGGCHCTQCHTCHNRRHDDVSCSRNDGIEPVSPISKTTGASGVEKL